MKFFGNISFKIWIYFSAILFLSSGLVTYYFTSQQKLAIIKYRGKELQELTRTIALGVELSLDENNFQKLNKSVNYYQTKKNDFDFLVLTQNDTLNNTESVFSKITDHPEFDFSKLDSNQYIFKSVFFSSAIMKGRIVIGISTKRINDEVWQSNLPIYITLLVILILTTSLFYLVARNVTSPIYTAIRNAKLLQEEKYNEFDIKPQQATNEIVLLQNALVSLKDSLLLQKLENKNLLASLEYKITERTENLNQTLIRLNEAQEIAALAYYSYNFQKQAFDCSDNLGAFLGVAFTKIEDFKSIIDADYQEEFETNIFRQPILPFSIELKTKLTDQKTNSLKWIAINGKCSTDKETGKCYLTGTVQDITERKNADAELRKLSQAVKTSFNGIIITDLNQRILWINDSLLKLTGYNRDEIIGNMPKMFQFEETCSETKAIIRENLKAFKSFKTEIQNKSKTGNIYWLELYIQPIYNEKGIPEGYMAIEIDITDRKEKEKLIQSYIQEIENKQSEIVAVNESLEQKVAEKTHDLELSIIQIQKSQDEIVKKEKMATLGVLIAGIAHEVNTPLGAIKASSDNLEYLFATEFKGIIHTISLNDLRYSLILYESLSLINPPSTIVQRQYAKQILEGIKKQFPEKENAFILSKELAAIGFENLTEDAQTLLQIDSYQDIMKLVKLLLNIQRSLKTINEGAVKSGKIIKALNVYSHGADQQEQAPFNLKNSIDNIIMLLWNKIKYHASVKNTIPENITLTGYEDELAQVWTNIINNALQASNNKCSILIEYREENNQHIVSIKNDGPKIPDDITPKIFDEFFTTKKRGEGTGLGLNIVKNIVEKHDGKIKCVSTEQNTTFTVTLPQL